MLNNANTIKGYTLDCLDGDLGKVKEFYFDDRYWTIRYLVVDTGNWLTGRKVLIAPHAVRAVNNIERKISVTLTKKQIEDSPALESDKPVSRQFEESYYEYYGWPMYWGGPYMWGSCAYPYMAGPYPRITRDYEQMAEAARREKAWDPHLRSTDDVSGRHIHAIDGDIGHVEEFLIDDENWAIRYLVINTRNWWLGKKVLVSPHWIERVSWSESKVFVNLSRETIKQSPQYTEETVLTRDYEASLHRHYNRQGYWVDEPAVKNGDQVTTAQSDGKMPKAAEISKGPIVIF
jgi:hypothetical protein